MDRGYTCQKSGRALHVFRLYTIQHSRGWYGPFPFVYKLLINFKMEIVHNGAAHAVTKSIIAKKRGVFSFPSLCFLNKCTKKRHENNMAELAEHYRPLQMH